MKNIVVETRLIPAGHYVKASLHVFNLHVLNINNQILKNEFTMFSMWGKPTNR